MRILVISRSPWRNDNNTGNTLTDFFKDIPETEVFSLCMREQLPQNEVSQRNFYISEKQLIKRLINRKAVVGAENFCGNDTESVSYEKRIYDTAKKHSNYILYFARELLWSTGSWKNENLQNYIAEIHPDIIFFPVFGCFYPHKILQYITSLCSAKVVLFHADDNYTCKQFHVSPIYWLYRLILRKWVRKSVAISDLNYVISEVQKTDYDKAFNKEHKILTKFADFSDTIQPKDQYNTPLQLIFTGNININRWKSLALIADVLRKINVQETKAELRIYTATPVTEQMREKLDIPGCSYLMGSVLSNEIPEIQSKADMLVHVEAMDLKNRLVVRQSFSTKLVDYMKSGRPILAVGPQEVASISHLIKHDCGIAAQTENDLYKKLNFAIENHMELNRIAVNAIECGRKYHSKEQMQTMLINDLWNLRLMKK